MLEHGLENTLKYYQMRRYMSNTLTNIKNTRNIDVAALNKALGERGYQISNGYGKLKDKTFRIAHMAETTTSMKLKSY